jgi:hypothetical protein
MANGDTDGKLRFESEYEGSFFTHKILAFLTQGLQISPLYKAEEPSSLVPKWLCPATESFVKPLTKQCNYLSALQSHCAKDTPSVTTEWNHVISRIFHAFLDKAENVKSNQEKKFAYEYLAFFLIGAIEGLRVVGHDERGCAEEIDLWVANQSKDAFVQKHFGDPFIVECKNWESPLGAKELRSIRSLMDHKNVRFELLLAKNGVTGSEDRDALSIIHRAFREGKIIVVLDHGDLLRCAKGMHPRLLIEEKVYDLFKRA